MQFTRRLRGLVILVTLIAFVYMALPTVPGTIKSGEAASNLGIIVPGKTGEKWYVCQGYNTSISHKGGDKYGLDLVSDSRAVGTSGCRAGYNNAQHRRVYTPVSGTIAWKYMPGGIVCIRINSTRSIKVAHMKTVRTAGYPAEWLDKPVGGAVTKGSSLGYVATPNEVANGGISHIHIGVFANTNCGSSGSIPFSSGYGTQINGTRIWDLPSNGTANQWRGTGLVR